MDNNKCNIERFSGFADHYDKYRPVPPKIVTQVLTNYINKKPALVVDLGCGTGLSTFLWSSVSDKVIGIDPNRDMLNKAIDKWNRDEESSNVVLQFGYGNDTNLESECADIITCSSSFQWMEPESTINEILRILRKGGVFAIYGPNQPPTFDWVSEKAYMDLFQRIYKYLDDNREEEGSDKLWTINEYMNIMKRSNEFRFTKEILVHHTVKMDADRFIGYAFSQGALQTIMKKNVSWIDDEISKFTEIVKDRMGNNEADAVFSYGVRVAVR